ncbi:MAG: outer membrane lipoprotein carrier protein LolA [Smithella sp.]|jgi:outer membrane lipoprotein carrier protein
MAKKNFKINKLFTTASAALCLILSLISVPACVFSEELPALDDVVQKLQSAYEKTKDLKADFVQEATMKSIKKTQREEGRVFFKNPKNMLWEYSKPKGKKLVINRQTAWLYLSSEKVAYRQKAESVFQSRLLINFFAGEGKLKDDFIIKYVEPKALDKDGNYVLKLIPKEKTPACNFMRLTVDKNKFYILQLSFDDFMGNSTMLRFSNISMNTGFSQKMFQFQPPAGVQTFEVP